MFPYLAFIDPAAVEAWDAQFRLRVCGQLVDRELDDTWRRVLAALCDEAPRRLATARLHAAMTMWRICPDDRLLRAEYSVLPRAWRDPPRGWVNAAAFVRDAFRPGAWLDLAALDADVSLLAAHLARLVDEPACADVGVLGFADALVMLDVRYDDPRARALAVELADAVATGAKRARHGRRACVRALALDLPGEAVVARFMNNVAPGFGPLCRDGVGQRAQDHRGAAHRWMRRFGRVPDERALAHFESHPDADACAAIDAAVRPYAARR